MSCICVLFFEQCLTSHKGGRTNHWLRTKPRCLHYLSSHNLSNATASLLGKVFRKATSLQNLKAANYRLKQRLRNSLSFWSKSKSTVRHSSPRSEDSKASASWNSYPPVCRCSPRVHLEMQLQRRPSSKAALVMERC